MLFDLNKGRPAKIDESLILKYQPEAKQVFCDKKITKIAVPETFTSEVEIKPRRNDIDFNNHVHNLVYIDYAMEALPTEIDKAQNFKSIRINYRTAVTGESKIIAKYAFFEEKHTVCIYDDSGELKTIILIQ